MWFKAVKIYLNMKGNIVILKLVMGDVHHMGFWMWIHIHWETMSSILRRETRGTNRWRKGKGCMKIPVSIWLHELSIPPIFLPEPSKSNKENGKHKQNFTPKYLQGLPRSLVYKGVKEEEVQKTKGRDASSSKCQNSTKGKWEYLLTDIFVKEVPTPNRPHFVAVSKKWTSVLGFLTTSTVGPFFFFYTNR